MINYTPKNKTQKKINKCFLLGLIYCNLDTDSLTSMTINAIHIAHS